MLTPDESPAPAGSDEATIPLAEDLAAWLGELASRVPALSALLQQPVERQRELGYLHTLQEICQQPLTWTETAARVLRHGAAFQAMLAGRGAEDRARTVVLTGSGSSLYAGECLRLALQKSLGIPVETVAGGQLLTRGGQGISPYRPCLVVSFARSGNSPESYGALDLFLETEPACRHLIITCNAQGRLAVSHQGDPRVAALALNERTHDRSLVMTSSFTNLVLAGRFLGMLDDPGWHRETAERLSRMARELLLRHTEALARAACRNFRSVVFLGDGGRFGAAREASLKMLEMTSGAVSAFCETYLGLRHGPMCAVHRDTLVVCFLSSDRLGRAYELDLLRELTRKQLGAGKVIVGQNIPQEILTAGDLPVECPGLADDDVPLLEVLVGQLLAFFRCRACGLQPDSPSVDGVINRVVESFAIHRRTET